MEPKEELGQLIRAVADLKMTASVRMGALEKRLKSMSADLGVLDSRLHSMESDLEIIKEYLVTRAQPSENNDEEKDEPEVFRIDPKFVAKTLKLTPKESLVAVALAEGSTVNDIAVAMDRKVTTVRWHVKEIHRKLNISRQAQLVSLVLLLPHRNGDKNENVRELSSIEILKDGCG